MTAASFISYPTNFTNYLFSRVMASASTTTTFVFSHSNTNYHSNYIPIDSALFEIDMDSPAVGFSSVFVHTDLPKEIGFRFLVAILSTPCFPF